MQLLDVKALRGPNVWGKASMIEARVDLSAWQRLGGADVLAFRQRLAAGIPSWKFRQPDSELGLDDVNRLSGEARRLVVRVRVWLSWENSCFPRAMALCIPVRHWPTRTMGQGGEGFTVSARQGILSSTRASCRYYLARRVCSPFTVVW